MDRNVFVVYVLNIWSIVALHPEGVDRNKDQLPNGYKPRNVALHPEGVDRNIYGPPNIKR